jgi:hypothetical protein
MVDFKGFGKIARLTRDCVVTEKIDGTNAQIYIGEDGDFLTGSRKRWITPENDNQGFSKWAHEHKEELMQLGPGRHFGEWWGKKINRAYGLDERRFSLFNRGRWNEDNIPPCCHVVPLIYEGIFTSDIISKIIFDLAGNGSLAAPGFMKPEGIVIYHTAAGVYFKKTIEGDEMPKGIL